MPIDTDIQRLQERAARIAEIKNLEARIIEIHEPISQKEAECQIDKYKDIVNLNDGRIATIPKNTIGKIFRHRGYKISRIFSSISELFETSLLGWTDIKTNNEGKKEQKNIKSIHNYINKFTEKYNKNDEFYIRFTVIEENTKPGKVGRNIIHSTAISNIAIYKKGDEGFDRVRNICPGVKNSTSPFIDKRLIEFFNSVKGKTS